MRFTLLITLLSVCLFSIIVHTESAKKGIYKKALSNGGKKTENKISVISEEKFPLVLSFMMKNEAHVLEKTLEPFLKAKVPCLLCDTGSTDDSIKIARELFKKYNYSNNEYFIVEKSFENFSISRNYTVQCTEKCFPNSGFLIMIDADWYIQNIQDLIKFCKEHINDQTEAYAIRICFNGSEYYVKRVFKTDKKVRFVRPIHESPVVKSSKRLPDNIYINWDDSVKGAEKSKLRFARDKAILIKELEKDPNDLLNVFYFAQTLGDLQEHDDAICWYKKILERKDDCQEEKLTACYRIAMIYEFLGKWPLALDYYLKAYNLNPNRAESLVKLAQHYLSLKEYATCYLFAKQACDIPYPYEAYWKDRDAYLYKRYDILAAVAWSLGFYDEGEKALNKALELNPGDKHLLTNLKVYQDHKKANLKEIKK